MGTVVVAAIFLTNWQSYQFLVLDGPIPLFYYALPGLLAASLVWLRPRVFSDLLHQPSQLWFVAYIFSGLLWSMFATQHTSDVNQEWRSRFLAFLFFCAGLILTTVATQQKVACTIVGCALFSVITYWLDFLFPLQFVPLYVEGSNPGRGAGFFIDANQAAYALIVMCIAVMPFVSVRFRFLVLLAMLAGVVPTFSRGAIAFATAVALLWAYFGQLKFRQILIIGLLAPLVILVGFNLFQLGLDADGANLDNLIGRIYFFTSGGNEADDFSVEERREVAELAWKIFIENPVLGDGVGATTTWASRGSTHNMYLLFLAEQGIFGGLLYLSLLFVVLLRGVRLLKSGLGQQERDIGAALTIFGIYYAFVGFFSHTLLVEPPSLFLLAFLLTAEIRATGKN